jgi:hypothetical protein
MASWKCQLRFGQKVHGLVTMDKFKTTCPKWMRDFFYACPKWVIFYPFLVKKIKNSSNVICRLISLAWQSEVGVRWWCMIFKLHWMSTSIKWCCKWTWQMFLTPSCIRPFSKNFVWQKISRFCVSLLCKFFMANNYPCCLGIIPSRDNFMFSFRLWACVKVTHSSSLFWLWLIFVPYEPLLLFFLHICSLCW